MERKEKIRGLLSNQFELNLFEASLASLEEPKNKLRFNNFAYSMRELSRHILHRLAPDENLKQCEWFKPETPDGTLTRPQRIKYAIQGGISDKALQMWGFDVTALKQNITKVNTTIKMLSKYTHINEDVFDISEPEVERLAIEVLDSFANIIRMIEDYRSELKSFLDEHIEDHMVDTVISNAYVNIDSLAPNYTLEYGEVTDYHISEINQHEIVVDVSGNIHVTLEYGSRQDRRDGDGLDVPQSFPYSTKIRYQIDEDFPSDDPDVEEFDVDTSAWYDESEDGQ